MSEMAAQYAEAVVVEGSNPSVPTFPTGHWTVTRLRFIRKYCSEEEWKILLTPYF